MKLFTTLLLALLAGVLVYAIRRRLKLALVVAGGAYLVLLPLRLLFSAGSLGDRLDDLLVPALAVFVAWVVLWQASLAYERRKKRRTTLPGRRRESS